LGYIWRECRRTDLLESGQETELTNALHVHARWLSDEENYTGETNHGLFEDAGLYLMGAYAAELPESDDGEITPRAGFSKPSPGMCSSTKGCTRSSPPVTTSTSATW
jgi:hypothetical protein